MQETFLLKFDVYYGEYAGSLFRNFLKNKYLRLFLLFLLGLALLSTLLGVATSSEMDIWVSLLSTIAPVLVISVFAPILYAGSRSVFKDVEIEFNHWGVSRKSDKINISKPWREIPKAEETKTAFHIYITKSDFIIIPKRAFKDDAEINSFGYFLSTRTDFKL